MSKSSQQSPRSRAARVVCFWKLLVFLVSLIAWLTSYIFFNAIVWRYSSHALGTVFEEWGSLGFEYDRDIERDRLPRLSSSGWAYVHGGDGAPSVGGDRARMLDMWARNEALEEYGSANIWVGAPNVQGGVAFENRVWIAGFVWQVGWRTKDLRLTAARGTRATPVDYEVFLVPFWFIQLLLTLPLARCVVARCTKAHRRARNHCIACGYDLRGAAGRCPECGTATKEETAP